MRGWPTNSDFNIATNFLGFSSVLGLPIFNAVIMGDPVLRDFRLGIESLIFFKAYQLCFLSHRQILGQLFRSRVSADDFC